MFNKSAVRTTFSVPWALAAVDIDRNYIRLFEDEQKLMTLIRCFKESTEWRVLVCRRRYDVVPQTETKRIEFNDRFVEIAPRVDASVPTQEASDYLQTTHCMMIVFAPVL